jgi:hypothetical protein
MKIEAYKPQPTEHPLAPVVKHVKELAVGESIRVSEIPLALMGDSAATFESRLIALGAPTSINVQLGDNFRTPASYIITRKA